VFEQKKQQSGRMNQFEVPRPLFILRLSFPEFRVTDGARTRDHWDHNPVLYQLSYGHRLIWSGLFLPPLTVLSIRSRCVAVPGGWRRPLGNPIIGDCQNLMKNTLTG
jgi:hypothetical protein